MNSYDSLKKQNTTRLGTAGVLALCVLLTATMLFGRLAGFAPADTRLYIPLTRSRGLTTVHAAASAPAARFLPTVRLAAGANPGFQTSDKNTVWSGETDIEIFRITYENNQGQVTVNSSNGDNLLAPGTENTYEFALENTGNVPLEYTMEMEAFFSHEDHKIPIFARLTDYQGNYLVGSPEATADVLELNTVSRTGTIDVGNIMPYTLYWEWPFEIDDVYDTMLGNMAVDEDITLTIIIRTTASYTDVPDPGGVPDTGDDRQIAGLVAMMLGSAAALMFLLLTEPRKKENANG